jgi:hypothetical protein
MTLPLFDVVHSHLVTRFVLTGPRASLLRTVGAYADLSHMPIGN